MVRNGLKAASLCWFRSLHRSPWRQEQLPAISVHWAENTEQTFPITSSRGRRLRQNPCPTEHHPESQGMRTTLEEPRPPAVGQGGGRAQPLPLTVERSPMLSDSHLRLQVPGPGWVSSLHWQCSHTLRAHSQGYEKGGEGQRRALIGEHPRLEKEISQEGVREDGWIRLPT